MDRDTGRPVFLTLEALRLSDLFLPGSSCFITSRHQLLHLDCGSICVCAPVKRCTSCYSGIHVSSVWCTLFPPPASCLLSPPFHKAALPLTHRRTLFALSVPLRCRPLRCPVLSVAVSAFTAGRAHACTLAHPPSHRPTAPPRPAAHTPTQILLH